MPWRETSVMDERLRFVARLLEGDSMSDVCRSFGISRKTGYKIFNRYKDEGLEALTDRSRRLQTDEIVVRGWSADRAAAISAERHGTETGCDTG